MFFAAANAFLVYNLKNNLTFPYERTFCLFVLSLRLILAQITAPIKCCNAMISKTPISDVSSEKITKETLQDLYVRKGLSLRQCSKELNTTLYFIKRLLAQNGIKPRPSGFQKGNKLNTVEHGRDSHFWKGGKIKKDCVDCGTEFEVFPSLSKSYVGCDSCRGKGRWGKKGRHVYVNCAWCDEEKKVKASEARNNKSGLFYCSQECYGEWQSEHKRGEENPRYKEKITVNCAFCGTPRALHQSIAEAYEKHFCKGTECRSKWMSNHYTGESNPKWIGGPDVCGYDAYAEKIAFAENVRRDPENDVLLQSKCAYCGKWFNPSKTQVSARISVLHGKTGGAARLYCSDGCKQACPTYRKIRHPEGFRKATSREVVPELRQMVFQRDNWQCQRCGAANNLHCHHIRGYTQHKMLAHDIDNCITLCKKCHKWSHTEKGCRYFELRCPDDSLSQ